MGPDAPERPRVLIVEDEFIVAFDIQLLMEDEGFHVIGPCEAARSGLHMLGVVTPDVAVLDVNLRDGTVFPLATALEAAGVPIVFCSAHVDRQELQDRYPQCRLVQKPYQISELIEAVHQALKTHQA